MVLTLLVSEDWITTFLVLSLTILNPPDSGGKGIDY